MNRLLLMMNLCTFKNISVFRVFVKSVEPNNNKSVFKLIGKLMVWIYLSLVALWRGQCSRKWAVALDTGWLSCVFILIGGGTCTCSLDNSISRRGSLEERGGEYGETMLRCVSVCSTLIEELWRGFLRPMGCCDA